MIFVEVGVMGIRGFIKYVVFFCICFKFVIIKNKNKEIYIKKKDIRGRKERKEGMKEGRKKEFLL